MRCKNKWRADIRRTIFKRCQRIDAVGIEHDRTILAAKQRGDKLLLGPSMAEPGTERENACTGCVLINGLDGGTGMQASDLVHRQFDAGSGRCNDQPLRQQWFGHGQVTEAAAAAHRRSSGNGRRSEHERTVF